MTAIHVAVLVAAAGLIGLVNWYFFFAGNATRQLGREHEHH